MSEGRYISSIGKAYNNTLDYFLLWKGHVLKKFNFIENSFFLFNKIKWWGY